MVRPMELLFLRHGESEGNALGILQGRRDFALTQTGREQAARAGAWLRARAISWDVAYCSPLKRARETAEIVSTVTETAMARPEPELEEIDAGCLSGLTRDDIARRFPEFLDRPLTSLADFSAFEGESYADVQARARRITAKLEDLHREHAHRVLVVGHGGINFQVVKALICEPVPRVCIFRMGNCTATLVRMRERRGTYLGEVVWHVPLELMAGLSAEGDSGLFR